MTICMIKLKWFIMFYIVGFGKFQREYNDNPGLDRIIPCVVLAESAQGIVFFSAVR